MAQLDGRIEPHLETPPLEKLNRFILWSFAAVGICLAAFGWLSTLSKLRFFLDGLDWSVDRVPQNAHAILRAVGDSISEAVLGYRELVRDFARLLKLPKMPPVVYDLIAITIPSAGLGYRLGMTKILTLREKKAESDELYEKYERRRRARRYRFGQEELDAYDQYYEEHIQPFRLALYADRLSNWLNGTVGYLVPWGLADRIAAIIFYGAVVSTVVAGLFGVDYLYRHFG
jgi:hypothetical protein